MKTTTINGLVTNQFSDPLEGAVITILEGTGSAPDIAAITNEKGEFSFSEVERGRYRLKAMYEQTMAYVDVNAEHSDSIKVIQMILR